MKVELPLGDVVDKITILLLKERHIHAVDRLDNVRRELAVLRQAWSDEGLPAVESLADWAGLCQVNGQLWQVEDDLRLLEAKGSFDAEFVAKARSVYQLNDHRAALKRRINIQLGSALLEEKSYTTGAP